MVSTKKRNHGRAAEKPTVDEFLSSRERMNRATTDFLKIDVDTALTFLHVARQTTDTIQRERSLQAARKAYETVKRLSVRVKLSHSDAQILTHGLDQLKRELQDMGESL